MVQPARGRDARCPNCVTPSAWRGGSCAAASAAFASSSPAWCWGLAQSPRSARCATRSRPGSAPTRARCWAAMSAPALPTGRRAMPSGSSWRPAAPCRRARGYARWRARATRLLRPGALVNYDYRLRLGADSDAAAWIRAARAAFPEAGWQLRSGADASPGLQRFIDRVGFFLSLVGITALLVGGVGIGNAVAGYIASKTASIATLKCLGASTRLVFTAYFLQVLAIALTGTAAGMLLGGAMPALLAPLVDGLLP